MDGPKTNEDDAWNQSVGNHQTYCLLGIRPERRYSHIDTVDVRGQEHVHYVRENDG